MDITSDAKIVLFGEPDDNEFANQRFGALNSCVGAIFANSLVSVEFEPEGVRFIFNVTAPIEQALNVLLLNEPENIVPVPALFLIYIQENQLNVRIYSEQDITLIDIDREQEIDLDDASPFLKCTVVFGTETNVETDVIYDAVDEAIMNSNDDALEAIIAEVRTLYDEEDEEEEGTRTKSKSKKAKAKNKRKMAKASKRKNRAKK